MSQKRVVFLIIALAIIFRLMEYVSMKSFWFDEARTALKIQKYSLAQMVNGETASKRQPYPAGFLVVEKMVSAVLGDNELSLRLFPFVCGVAAIFVFYSIAVEVVGKEWGLLALSFFSFSPSLIYYASELKPYSSDILITVIIFKVFLQICSRPLSVKKIILYGLLGGSVVWFSYSVIFIMFGAGIGLFIYYCLKKDWAQGRTLMVICLLWLIHFIVFYFVYIRFFVKDPTLVHYWRVAYMPQNVFSGQWVQWVMGSFSLFYKNNLKFPISLAAFSTVLGCSFLWMKKREHFLIFIPPVLVALLASSFKMYPFQGRLIMFLVPSFFICIVCGLKFLLLYSSESMKKGIISVLVIFFLFYPVLHSIRQFKEMSGRSELKPVMTYLQKNRDLGDTIYLYYSSEFAFKYYSEQFGFSSQDYIVGKEARKRFKEYDKDLHQLYGKRRVWIVFSDVFFEKEGVNEREYFLKVLNNKGKQLKSFTVNIPPYFPPMFYQEAFSAGVYLYDFSQEVQ